MKIDENKNNLKASQTKFDLKVNVKLKEIKSSNLDESGFLNVTNSDWRSTQKVAPFKVNTKFTDALNETTITKEVIDDLNKSTFVNIIFLYIIYLTIISFHFFFFS